MAFAVGHKASEERAGVVQLATAQEVAAGLDNTKAITPAALKESGIGAAKPIYVATLPEEGEEGVLYLVNSGNTRDGYAIFQMFSWHNNEWVAIGAFDVGITPTGLVYEKSFDATTGTWVVTVEQ